MARLTREDLRTPVAMWSEEDVIGSERVQAFVLIMRTSGCWWSRKGGCTMCGYNAVSSQAVSPEDLRAQLERAAARYKGETMVKVYTSGSFLDEEEVPPDVRDEVFNVFKDASRILFESRPEFITPETLASIDERSAVAIGLESSNDEVLRRCVRKGFAVADYVRAAEALRSAGIPLRTYLLLKPPYMTEAAAVEDAVASIEFASKYSESVSINPVNVQSGTPLESLWRRGGYRPPFTWSLLEVLRRGSEVAECRLMSSPSGGGTRRGIHSCAECDAKVLDAVRRFSLTQDPAALDAPGCRCRAEWEAAMSVQGVMSTAADIGRHLDSGTEMD